jgi:hypothetical protein
MISMNPYCQWLASIEPRPEHYGIKPERGFYIRFDTQQELAAVLAAARGVGQHPNRYMAESLLFAAKMDGEEAKLVLANLA